MIVIGRHPVWSFWSLDNDASLFHLLCPAGH